MPTNVEVKARVREWDAIQNAARALSGGEGLIIVQEDTFYKVERGRLKLRCLGDGHAELIFYDRPDAEGPKGSDFSKSPVVNPNELKVVLAQALGEKGCVRKRRILHMVGQTRVHLDEVEGLGRFMELEVMLREGQTLEEGSAIANALLADLGVDQSDLLSGAYMDMLAK
eukprot:Opistho-2@2282